MTKIIFLRHAETQKNPTIPTVDWNLSAIGQKQATKITQQPEFENISVIYTSEELKSIQTAQPLAQKLGLTTIPNEAFNEVIRGESFLSKEAFEQEKERQLQDLSYHAFNGESGFEALERFKRGIEEITINYPNDTILVVSHGTILNIYFSYLRGTYHDLPERWQRTAFCAFGIIEDGILIKDIIK